MSRIESLSSCFFGGNMLLLVAFTEYSPKCHPHAFTLTFLQKVSLFSPRRGSWKRVYVIWLWRVWRTQDTGKDAQHFCVWEKLNLVFWFLFHRYMECHGHPSRFWLVLRLARDLCFLAQLLQLSIPGPTPPLNGEHWETGSVNLRLK